MQVHCDEGVAIHIGPESCAGSREAAREVLTGEHAGQPSSRESLGCRRFPPMRKAIRPDASVRSTRRGRRPWHAWTLLAREPGGLVIGQCPSITLVRIGKVRNRSR